MIPNELISTIKSAAKIEEIIGDYIALKRIGANYKGCCPFHNEQTPSFIVSSVKGFYKCFGCGKGGDAVGFVQEMDRISFPEALKKVGWRYGIDVPDRELSAQELAAYQKREIALNELEKQNQTFKEALTRNSSAQEWLTISREITPETIKKWGLGFAMSGFFAGRITYPIHNSKGELVGFTGRRLKEDLEPKFRNSAKDELFNKSELLYGLYQAKMKIHKAQKCYVVEGQHDVLMMHQYGFENTVAPSGTAFTTQQIALIKPWTRNLVLVLDADLAGQEAAIKHISTLLTEQINIRIVLLPEKEDPDSFLRKQSVGCDANLDVREYIESNELNFIEFKAAHFAKEITEDPEKKGELINEITNDISLISDKNVRLAYTQKCSAIFDIKPTELTKDITRLREKLKVENEEGTWFAWDEASESIKENKEANILSHFDEVIDYHLADNKNYLGMNCAPLKKGEILKLMKLTKTVIFDEYIIQFYDKKTKDESATIKNLKRLISFGMDVRMRLGDGGVVDEDTGEISDPEYINFTDWYILKITALLSPADDLFASWAIEHIAELLSFLPESSRMIKLGNVQGFFKAAGVKMIIGDFKKILDKFLKKNAKTFEPDLQTVDMTENPMNLSHDQLNDLNRYQHYFERNSIHHVSKTGHIARIANFIIIPIIHSNTSNGHFKLFEMNNEDGNKTTISLETVDLNDVRRFKCKVEAKGNFIWKGDQFQLDNVKERLYANTTYSNEIEQLGWQSEGFWAWCDGITLPDGKFTKTDDNGLITVGDQNYLIRPFSNLYANDKTAYTNEKKFLHKTSDVTFEDWSKRYRNVFGDNSMICMCTLVTSFYSDAIFKIVHGELPMINFFGPKGTGKTFQAESLLAFFGEKQDINNLSKVTVYGLSQTLKSFHNALCLIDEYKNSLEMRWIEMLKSIFNRQGKIQGNFAMAGSKTEHIPINQMVLLCGQDLPTLDVALLERCLCLTAYKSDYTDEQKSRYNELKDLEERGFAHLTDDFLKYRELVIERFAADNGMIQTLISQKCKDVSVRLQKNLSTILTTFHILKDHFKFPFTFDEVLEFGLKVIRDQQKFIESSDDLKNFWSIFATLLEQDRIKEGRNYVLHDVVQLKYVGSDQPITYGNGKTMLFLRWDGLYPMYAEYSRRSNMVALGEKTIQFYLEKTKYFQGRLKSKKFRDKQTGQVFVNQAYCFDYLEMKEVISLIETNEPDIETGNEDMRTDALVEVQTKMVYPPEENSKGAF